jgi:hypothetical protein
MSSAENNPLAIPPELEAEIIPAVRVFIKSLLEQIERLKARVGLNPQNSSLPPSTQHLHARPPTGGPCRYAQSARSVQRESRIPFGLAQVQLSPFAEQKATILVWPILACIVGHSLRTAFPEPPASP